MTVPLLDSPSDTPLRTLRTRWRWLAIPAVVVALAVGAFLYWGPIGIGNGPLSVTLHGAEGWPEPGDGPVGIILPISNRGHAPAVIDAVDVVGGTGYASPRVLASAVVTRTNCAGATLALPTATGHGFVLAGCGGSNRGSLAGHAVLPSGRLPAAVEMAAPLPGTCWVMTRVVVHYHVGIRHFSASGPVELAVCRGVDSASVLAAMRAADGNAV